MKHKVLSVTIHDCEVQTFRSGGKGGQNQNKRDTGVRVIHRPSGAVGESREQRSQLQNKRSAFLKMVNSPKFRLWIRMSTGKSALIDSQLEKDMAEENIRTEYRLNGRWTETDSVV
jgi:protein subunit release factor B